MNNYWDEYEWLHHAESDEEAVKNGCIFATAYIAAFAILILLCVLMGCGS